MGAAAAVRAAGAARDEVRGRRARGGVRGAMAEEEAAAAAAAAGGGQRAEAVLAEPWIEVTRTSNSKALTLIPNPKPS